MVRRGIEGGGISFDYNGPQGNLVDSNMFGGTKKTEEQMKTGNIEYQQYEDSIKFVKDNQIGEPSDPSAWFANDLHATIAEELGLEDYGQLKFYTAIGSSLDKYHSIDGFFELQVDPENPDDVVRVTIDLTTNPEKNDYRADFIILVPREGLDRKDEDYRIVLAEHAREIASKLKPYLKKAVA